MNLQESAEKMRRRWENDSYPKLVYVETTNFCNAKCSYCLYERMERPVEWMSQQTFELVVQKVKERGLKIGAMFCFGEPLADAGIFDKIRYGRNAGVLTPHLGLNTNVSLMTPSKFPDMVETCTNITLSFPNVGESFEKMTGLNWAKCYSLAKAFIEYRDRNAPSFKIQIGCNDVRGHDRGAVAGAFAGYRVDWARDAEIQWSGKTIIGVIDRSIMYHKWGCDGFKGALQVKPNGDCCFCAYDVVRNETAFANIIDDDWGTIEQRFKDLWREPSSLCLRCDFWWNYHQMVEGGWKRGPHIDSSWQEAYADIPIEEHWNDAHQKQSIRWLTDTSLRNVLKNLVCESEFAAAERVLNIGVGTGRCTREMVAQGKAVDSLDVSDGALKRVGDVVKAGFRDIRMLPERQYDLAVCHLVAQHMTDVDLIAMIRNVVRSLKPKGVLAIQYAAPMNTDAVYEETLERMIQGRVHRTEKHFRRILASAGGASLVSWGDVRWYGPTVTDKNVWKIAHVSRVGL